MKTLTIILMLFLAMSLSAQNDTIKLCFKTSNQANRQTGRLNEHYRYTEWNSVTQEYEESFKFYVKSGDRYCVYVKESDFSLIGGRYNTLTIKRRHHKFIK